MSAAPAPVPLRTLLIQQYGTAARKSMHEYGADAWQWWTAQKIAIVTQSPVENVQLSWPPLYDALRKWNIASYNTCRGVIGTVAIETAHTFMPVREAFWLSETWRAANLRYYPWYGRGFLQLTWESNYRYFGQLIGTDLLSNPDRAMDPVISAQVLAAFCSVNGVAAAFDREDWAEGRRRVQGAYAGLPELLTMVAALAS